MHTNIYLFEVMSHYVYVCTFTLQEMRGRSEHHSRNKIIYYANGGESTHIIDRMLLRGEIGYVAKYTTESIPRNNTNQRINLIIVLLKVDIEIADTVLQDAKYFTGITLYILCGDKAWVVGENFVPEYSNSKEIRDMLTAKLGNCANMLNLEKLVVKYLSKN